MLALSLDEKFTDLQQGAPVHGTELKILSNYKQKWDGRDTRKSWDTWTRGVAGHLQPWMLPGWW